MRTTISIPRTSSNAIPSVAQILINSLRKFYPQINADNIHISANLGGSKAGEGKGFQKLLEKTDIDPQTTLFIDDIEAYTDRARGTYGLRTFHFRGNRFKGISAVKRLGNELRKAELIS